MLDIGDFDTREAPASARRGLARRVGRHQAEDWMAVGFGDERFHRSLRRCVEERTRDRDVVRISLQYQSGFVRADLDHVDRLGSRPAGQDDAPGRPRVPHPVDLPIRRDEPPPAGISPRDLRRPPPVPPDTATGAGAEEHEEEASARRGNA